MMIKRAPEVNRAFSADGFFDFTNPGALPQAASECRAFGAKQGKRHRGVAYGATP